MAKGGAVLAKVRKICLALPDTEETLTWGQPHFRVRNKIFCGCGEEGGKLTLGFKLEREHADTVVLDARFTRAPYVGHKGWVSMDASRSVDWRLAEALIHESYGLIAPKTTLAKLAAKPDKATKTRSVKAAPRKRRRRP